MGKRLRPSCFRLPLPRLRGIGVYADAGEAGEGVLQQGQNKTYPTPHTIPYPKPISDERALLLQRRHRLGMDKRG